MKFHLRCKLGVLVLLFGLFFNAAQAAAMTVKDIRIGLHPDKTRMVIELSEIGKFRAFVLADPWRLVIDLPAFDWQVGRITNPTRSAVGAIRQGPLQPGVSRIAVDLKQPVIIDNAFLLRASQGKPDRLVIDFTPTTAEKFAADKGRVHGLLKVDEAAPAVQAAPRPAEPPARAAAAHVPPPAPPAQEAQPVLAASGMALPGRKPAASAPAAQHGKYIIVIDPGHGGVDPGAIGANGTFEKHVALAMAKELKSVLERSGRYDVRLTRDKDIYLRLYQRVDIARAAGADLFISLHADSIGKAAVSGASVYTLSDKASDAQTAELADRENKADIIAGVDLSHEDEQVAKILIDLVTTDTKNQSVFFANALVDNLKYGDVKILEKPHRHAGFAVLKAPDVPSVLIEMGFMSNKSEAQLLSNPEYRQKIARAIARGIDAYFEKVGRNSRS